MTVFWQLLLAHLLTDFTFQTNSIAAWKRKSVWGVLIHSGIFLILSVIFTWHELGNIWWKFPGYVCIGILFLMHFAEDFYRIISIKRAGSPDNIFFFIWDQSIHVIFIFLFSPLLTGNIAVEKPFIILSLAVLVTHFTSILIYYIEESVYGSDPAANRLKGKYFLILERLFIFVCMLLPGYWWVIFPSAWIVRPLLHKNKTDFSFSWVNVIISNLSAVGLGALSRIIIYS